MNEPHALDTWQENKIGFAPAAEIIDWTLDYIEEPSDFDALETYVVQCTHAAIAAHSEAQKH